MSPIEIDERLEAVPDISYRIKLPVHQFLLNDTKIVGIQCINKQDII